MRYIIIGDVHGCYDELSELLNKVSFDRSTDTIGFVGDYFDRGPKSYEVLRLLMDLKNEMRGRCILVRGNHEQMMLDYYAMKDRAWDWNGNQATIDSFNTHECSPADYLDWISNNTSLYHCGDSFDIVHAERGKRDLSETDLDTLIWSRRLCKGMGEYNGKLTFAGHTPLSISPVYFSNQRPNLLEFGRKYYLPENGLINIDTSCVYGHLLTAAIIEDGRLTFECVASKQGE